jgi:hypothetical protein
MPEDGRRLCLKVSFSIGQEIGNYRHRRLSRYSVRLTYLTAPTEGVP